ncbi:unnamed protein product, partial [Ectocarpus sp. 12 AP-2014]
PPRQKTTPRPPISCRPPTSRLKPPLEDCRRGRLPPLSRSGRRCYPRPCFPYRTPVLPCLPAPSIGSACSPPAGGKTRSRPRGARTATCWRWRFAGSRSAAAAAAAAVAAAARPRLLPICRRFLHVERPGRLCSGLPPASRPARHQRIPRPRHKHTSR